MYLFDLSLYYSISHVGRSEGLINISINELLIYVETKFPKKIFLINNLGMVLDSIPIAIYSAFRTECLRTFSSEK